jgi:hypothetical protein
MARNIYSYIGICQAFLPAVGIAFVTGLKGFGGRVLAANPAQEAAAVSRDRDKAGEPHPKCARAFPRRAESP